MKIRDYLKEKIKIEFKKYDLTSFENKSGYSKAYISNVVNGRKSVSFKSFMSICSHLEFVNIRESIEVYFNDLYQKYFPSSSYEVQLRVREKKLFNNKTKTTLQVRRLDIKPPKGMQITVNEKVFDKLPVFSLNLIVQNGRQQESINIKEKDFFYYYIKYHLPVEYNDRRKRVSLRKIVMDKQNKELADLIRWKNNDFYKKYVKQEYDRIKYHNYLLDHVFLMTIFQDIDGKNFVDV